MNRGFPFEEDGTWQHQPVGVATGEPHQAEFLILDKVGCGFEGRETVVDVQDFALVGQPEELVGHKDGADIVWDWRLFDLGEDLIKHLRQVSEGIEKGEMEGPEHV